MTRSTFAWALPEGPPLTEAQRALVVDAAHLAPVVVKRFVHGWSAGHYADDLLSVAYEGILRAARLFSPGGNSWRSYAYGGAFMQCRAWLQAMRVREMPSLDEPAGEGGDASWLELHASREPGPEDLTFRRQVAALAEPLPKRERLAIQRRLDGRTLEEVGKEIGCSRAAVQKWDVSALQMLREQLGVAVERTRRKSAPLDGEERFRALLADGTPRTMHQLAELTGYTRSTVGEKLRTLGAVQVGVTSRNGRAAPLWAIPRKAA